MRLSVKQSAELDHPLKLAVKAETEISGLEPLLLRARSEALAARSSGQVRGRRGSGSEFWQFSPAAPGEHLRNIDWRQSARSEQLLVREHELVSPDTILCWADNSSSMAHPRNSSSLSKSDRARVLALALAMLLLDAGDRVAVAGGMTPPRAGQDQVERLAADLLTAENPEYGIPPETYVPKGTAVALFSDFLADWKSIERSVNNIAAQRTRGVLVQVLDQSETDFRYTGRIRFQSPRGTIQRESYKADELREGYSESLVERQARLSDLASSLGWFVYFRRANESVAETLLWICAALETEIK